tara:strand:+ start:142 stop:630 length:489 start_codon:yes stop_codon:yes gene_type:complete
VLHNLITIADSLTYEVRNFRKKSQYSWNWSCQVCGDSATNPRKARFWVDEKDQGLVCHCFNCGYSANFISYIKDYHPQQYETYKRETVDEVLPSTFDLDSLFNKKGISDDTLLKLFYGDKHYSKKELLRDLVSKKIRLRKYNLLRLLKLHDEHHEKRISKST